MPTPRHRPRRKRSETGGRPASEPAFLVLGRILRPHGVYGELRLQIATAYPERIAQLQTVYIGPTPYDTEQATAFEVSGIRRHREYLLIRLEGINTREEAELYRDQLLMVALADAVPLSEGEYYVFQILGSRVITQEGEELGRISEVLETGANDVFVVQGGPRGEVLIPDIPHVVVDVDIDNKVVTVAPPPGLLPD